MKINDVIKKCIKIPGISIKQAEYSMELILNTKEGKGSMTFFSLFPGLSLAYIFINSPTWTAPDLRSDSSITKGPLLLNYCVTGRCEMILNNKNFVSQNASPKKNMFIQSASMRGLNSLLI